MDDGEKLLIGATNRGPFKLQGTFAKETYNLNMDDGEQALLSGVCTKKNRNERMNERMNEKMNKTVDERMNMTLNMYLNEYSNTQNMDNGEQALLSWVPLTKGKINEKMATECVQPIAFGVSFNLILQSHWSLFTYV